MVKKLQTKIQNKLKTINYFLPKIFIYGSAKKLKKHKEDKQILAYLSSAHHHSQAACQQEQTSYINGMPCNKYVINRA